MVLQHFSNAIRPLAMMRDKGFDFEWYDQYCNNLFAIGHERSKGHYDVATSFELFEHIYNPAQNLGELFQSCDNLIVSTSLISKNTPPTVNEWWYYCTDHGQHVSFYTREAMEILAAQFGKHFASNGDFHLFTAKPVNEKTIALCCCFSKLINRIIRYPSLLSADYEKITGKTL